MQNIRFENPEWLLLLLLLPVLLYSYVRAHRGRQSSVQFSDLGVLHRATASLWPKLRHGLLALKILGLGCLIAAMARPQAGREVREISGEGIDIMLTLDISSSMELNDLDEGQKSRLQ
ncbi:MAG: aerotolerance regulator BatA, partial [Gemmatimonadetes bacterium]|nr:aerotolerance regulator BatA [Gemmatimonadota bacterium]